MYSLSPEFPAGLSSLANATKRSIVCVSPFWVWKKIPKILYSSGHTFSGLSCLRDHVSTSRPRLQPIILVLSLFLLIACLERQIGDQWTWPRPQLFTLCFHYAFQVLNYLPIFKYQTFIKKIPTLKFSGKIRYWGWS